ncbi:hypothetical protein NYO98_10575 [Nocardioides sp. STR2]|uniref:DUF1918 domain-containing protein n=1 Tax=Nocardioides pini TaxID=2975053 RepID=A0ABT4CCN9_9ACTN|nr:hypothetical protein [Nocardioides pini]MCY4726723.1 hypothetical protein [Nocardioides pini]
MAQRGKQKQDEAPDAVTTDPTETPEAQANVAATEKAGLSEDTPVIAADGREGKVLSVDGITGQVQIGFPDGSRGWYVPAAVRTGDGG